MRDAPNDLSSAPELQLSSIHVEATGILSEHPDHGVVCFRSQFVSPYPCGLAR